jgi:predicted O-methyltransferase YrrM
MKRIEVKQNNPVSENNPLNQNKRVIKNNPINNKNKTLNKWESKYLQPEESRFLDKFLKEASAEKIPVIDKSTGRFLELTCILVSPYDILEIGCGIGFSSYFLIKNLKDGNYTGIDLNADRVKRAEKFIKSKFPDRNFRFITGNALRIIPELNNNKPECKYDMVFIDAAKFEYPLYIRVVEPLLKKGALIIADNIFYKNKIFSKKIDNHDLNSVKGIRDYIDYITGKPCFESYFFDIGDGISVTKYLDL